MRRSVYIAVAVVLLGTAGCALKNTNHTPTQTLVEPETLYMHIERLGEKETDPVAYIKDTGHFSYHTPQRTVTYYASNGDGVIDTIHVDDGEKGEQMYLRVGEVICRVTPRVCLATSDVFHVRLFESAILTQQWLIRAQLSGTKPPMTADTALQAELSAIFRKNTQ